LRIIIGDTEILKWAWIRTEGAREVERDESDQQRDAGSCHVYISFLSGELSWKVWEEEMNYGKGVGIWFLINVSQSNA
jgi:hypothetical protein